jgi:tungsten cofactor oxidoreducase radical SAM maturase
MPLRKLYLELTSSCNLDCAMCYRRSWAEAPGEMSSGAFARLLEFSERSDSLETVVLGGIGEPTASPLFTRALEAFSLKNVIVTTNAVSPGEKSLVGMVRYADRLVVSVDGMHDAFRRLRGSDLDSVLMNIRKLTVLKSSLGREKPKIEFQFVLSSFNAGDLPDVIDLAADNGIDTVSVSHLLPQEEDSAASILYGRYQSEEAMELYRIVRFRAMRRGVNVLLPHLELKTERRCAFAEDGAAFVNSAGEVCPCYRFSRDGEEFVFGRKKHVEKVPFGNIEKEPLEAIWESASYASFRRILTANRYPSCPDCDLLEGCNLTADTNSDCWANSPSCADCIWARGYVRCP